MEKTEKHTTSYIARRVVGNGSFGVVYQATVGDTNEVVAIKKVLQDKRFKNRELSILKKLDHPNVVKLYNSFYSNNKEGDLYLNLVMEYIPETLYRNAKRYAKNNTLMPMTYVKVCVLSRYAMEPSCTPFKSSNR